MLFLTVTLVMPISSTSVPLLYEIFVDISNTSINQTSVRFPLSFFAYARILRFCKVLFPFRMKMKIF